MPNWCYNKLQVGGAKPEVKELRTMMSEGFSLEKITPTPKKLFLKDGKVNRPLTFSEGMKKTGGGLPDWYSWRLENWGTKWDVLHLSTNTQKKVLFNDETEVEFQTAWSPPIIALKTLSEKLKKLIFKLEYIDEQMNFKGKATIKDGYVHDVCRDVDVDIDNDILDYVWKKTRQQYA